MFILLTLSGYDPVQDRRDHQLRINVNYIASYQRRPEDETTTVRMAMPGSQVTHHVLFNVEESPMQIDAMILTIGGRVLGAE